MVATDLKGVVTFATRGAEAMLGYPDGVLAGRSIGEIFSTWYRTAPPHEASPDLLPAELVEIFEYVGQTGSWSGVRTLSSCEGFPLRVRLTVSLMFDGTGEPSGFLCIPSPLPEAAQAHESAQAHSSSAQLDLSLFQPTLDGLPHPVYLKGKDGVFLGCNRRFSDFLGMDPEDIVGQCAATLHPPQPWITDALAGDASRGARSAAVRERTVRRAGDPGTVLLFHEASLTNPAGSHLGTIGCIFDVTRQTRIEEELQLQATMLEDEIAKHQRSEEALREREKMLSLVINAVPQSIYWKDTNSVYAGCNELFARSAGLSSPAEVVGKTDFDLPWRPEETRAYQRDDREVMRRDRAKYHILETQLQAGGNLISVDSTKIPLHADCGSVVGVLGVYDDITNRMKVEKELKESKERLSVIFEASQAGIILVAPDGTISFANRRMAEMFGVETDELLGTSYSSWLHPGERSEGAILVDRLCRADLEAVTVERHYLRRDGSDFWGYLSGRRLENADGSLRALVGCIADVTELKASKCALEREKERLAVTLRSIGDGVITVDTDGRVVLMNRVAEGLCGYRQEEAAGLPLDQVFRVVDEKTRLPKENCVERALRGESIEQSGNGVLLCRGGRERIIVSKTAPILDREQQIPGAVLVCSDVTERREIEEELFKARKLESLGILAGGIAHDFNNLLTGIMGNISLSRAKIPNDHQAATFLDRARIGSEQAKELTQQLLTFSKGGAPVKQLTSISQVLIDSATFALRGSNVRCDFDIAPDLWCVEVDPGQMSQVISNLVINADQAMPDGGSIMIRAENVLALDEADQSTRIRITIKDTGAGISEEDLNRIYDPYFSTKATGSGLGLATVYAIVKNHDGEIRVFSRVNHGTTFAITLPAQQGAAPEPPETASDVESPPAVGGRVLLMDDEEAIREMAAAALSMFGYNPEVASDGEDMLAQYREALESGDRFDAVIMDLTVPGGMGGKEAVKKLLEMDPNALAIASSGYSDDQVMANYREYGFAGRVLKPYSLQELDTTLQQIIVKG